MVMAVAGFGLALSPVVTASAAGRSQSPPAAAAPAAQGGGVQAGIVVHGRAWAGKPAG